MKIVFFGTPDYVVPILEAIHKKFRDKKGNSPFVAVVTQKPKPTGRKQILTYSQVDNWAHRHKVPVYYDGQDLIKEKISGEVGILASYGALLPSQIINYFSHGILVIHPSLLPQFRWGSPVPATIALGVNPTGVTIIKMDEKFDHGPIISQFEEEVLPDDTAGTLRARLFLRSAEVLATLLPPYLSGKIKLREQDHNKATFARIITKEDAFIPPKFIKLALEGKTAKESWPISFVKDYSHDPTPVNIESFIRAMDPWPMAWTILRLNSSGQAKRLKILKAHIDGKKLVLDQVQLEGKNPVSWKEFTRGYPNAELEE